MSEFLKSCPFCGNLAERKGYKKYRKGFLATVGCSLHTCPAKISQATLHGIPEDAYKYAEKAWNTRALDKDLHSDVEECINDLRESADSYNEHGDTILVEHAAVIIREYFIPEVTEDEEK